MEMTVEQKERLKKVAMMLPTSTVRPILPNAGKTTFKSVDKVFGQGQRALKPGGMKKVPTGAKNITNAFSTSKGLTEQTADLGKSGLTKLQSENGELMKQNILNSFYDGVKDALEKVAQIPMAPMPGQMPPQQAAAPAAPMVGGDMGAVQADMGAAPAHPGAQASPEELQQVQNSGITPGDIASAAKVIQTMAEMKANADMAGMQPVDQTGVQAPGAPAPQG